MLPLPFAHIAGIPVEETLLSFEAAADQDTLAGGVALGNGPSAGRT